MRAGHAFLAAALSHTLIQRVGANIFYLSDQWSGNDFFQDWNWETKNDPTHGRVNYVSQDEAKSKNLAYVDGNKFVMRADDWSIVNASARGRDSVRVSSQSAYDEVVFVLDLAHMPAGCATWPAFWTKSQTGPWPVGGEVDIIEGVNSNEQNRASLHTVPGCTIPPAGPGRLQTGTSVSDNCDASVNNNSGCAVLFGGGSYGASFNLNGGGYYAISRSRDYGIQIWFWQRNSPNVPPEIAQGQGDSLSPNPTWGEPAADFPLDPNDCNYDQHFNAHMLIFDLTFCGDWAGSDWATSSCSTQGTCEDFVNNRPTAFSEAYWEINSLRVYTPN